MQPILSIRQRAAQREFASAPTQTTSAIKLVKLVNTGPLQTIIEPPASQVIHLASVMPSLADLTPMSQNIVLSAYRMAYQHRRVWLKDAVYVIEEIYADPNHVGRILARLERVWEDA